MSALCDKCREVCIPTVSRTHLPAVNNASCDLLPSVGDSDCSALMTVQPCGVSDFSSDPFIISLFRWLKS